MFAFTVVTMTLIIFACAMAWFASEALSNWSEVPKYRMLEREQNYERAQRRGADSSFEERAVKKTRI